MDDRRFSGRLPFLAYTGGIAWRRVQEVGVYLLAIDQALHDEEGQGDEAKRSVPCPYPALPVGISKQLVQSNNQESRLASHDHRGWRL